jgi:hypothetical protein
MHRASGGRIADDTDDRPASPLFPWQCSRRPPSPPCPACMRPDRAVAAKVSATGLSSRLARRCLSISQRDADCGALEGMLMYAPAVPHLTWSA